MLVGMKNVAAMPKHEIRDGRYFTLAVGAGDEKDGGGFHVAPPSSLPLAASGQACGEWGDATSRKLTLRISQIFLLTLGDYNVVGERVGIANCLSRSFHFGNLVSM